MKHTKKHVVATRKQPENSFIQGYACAVATLISLNDCITTDAKELFKAGLNMAMLYDAEIDEEDIRVFKKYKEELK